MLININNKLINTELIYSIDKPFCNSFTGKDNKGVCITYSYGILLYMLGLKDPLIINNLYSEYFGKDEIVKENEETVKSKLADCQQVIDDISSLISDKIKRYKI